MTPDLRTSVQLAPLALFAVPVFLAGQNPWQVAELLFDMLCQMFAFVTKRRQLLGAAMQRPEL
jgi:hypothetical protein